MKNKLFLLLVCLIWACSNPQQTSESTATNEPADGGQSTVVDNESAKNVVGVAVSSPDHTTLVTAVKAAELVDALSNAGPFTVFAPTNDAFNKLPAGTVENLLKPESKEALQNILQYHVAVAVYRPESFQDGQVLNMVNGDNANITVKDGKVQINGANIVASIPASNGIVHVIDAVILPPKK